MRFWERDHLSLCARKKERNKKAAGGQVKPTARIVIRRKEERGEGGSLRDSSSIAVGREEDQRPSSFCFTGRSRSDPPISLCTGVSAWLDSFSPSLLPSVRACACGPDGGRKEGRNESGLTSRGKKRRSKYAHYIHKYDCTNTMTKWEKIEGPGKSSPSSSGILNILYGQLGMGGRGEGGESLRDSRYPLAPPSPSFCFLQRQRMGREEGETGKEKRQSTML